MAEIIKTTFLLRRGYKAVWERNNPILATGEPGFVIDENRLKIGDGITPWNDLDYIGEAERIESISATVGELVSLINGTVDENGQPNGDGLIDKIAFVEETVERQGALIENKADADKVYTKEEADAAITTAIAKAEHLRRVIISSEQFDALNADPSMAEKNVIYMVKVQSSAGDSYKEYMRFDSESSVSFEQIGDTTVDLEPYAKIEDVEAKIAEAEEKIDGKISEVEESIDSKISEVEGFIEENKQSIEKVSEHLESVEQSIEDLSEEYVTKEELAQLSSTVKYEVSHKPEGTLVRIRDNEIRIMCPADTQWEFQTPGENGNANMHYIGLKIYAPNSNIHSFKEDMAEVIGDQTMWYFENNPYAGIDENGRKYSIVWLAVALYNGETQSWTYYGEKSSVRKYIGWNYSVEWYDENGKLVDSDSIRINLSNESCHNVIEPYYMGAINVNKLVQNENEFLILYGGSASENI